MVVDSNAKVAADDNYDTRASGSNESSLGTSKPKRMATRSRSCGKNRAVAIGCMETVGPSEDRKAFLDDELSNERIEHSSLKVNETPTNSQCVVSMYLYYLMMGLLFHEGCVNECLHSRDSDARRQPAPRSRLIQQ